MSKHSLSAYFEKSPGVDRVAAILLFDGVTLQDWVGVYHGLNALTSDGLTVHFVARQSGLIKDDRGRATIVATHNFKDVSHPDILIIPGGDPFGETFPLKDAETLDWVRAAHAAAEYTVTVCSGSLILAAVGALEGKQATTMYLAKDVLQEMGAQYSPEHCVEAGKIISAAGTSGGIEAGFRLVEKIAGRAFAEALQLATEYAPTPVYGTGHASQASAEVHQRVRQLMEIEDLPTDLHPSELVLAATASEPSVSHADWFQACQFLCDQLTPAMINRLNTVIKFHFTDSGETYAIDARPEVGRGWIKGTPTELGVQPLFEVTMSRDDFPKLVFGKLNPIVGVFTGKMKIKGDRREASKLSVLTASK